MCGYINESLHDGIPTIWYQRLNLSLSPTNHQDRINLIIAFMDELIFPAPPVMHRKKTLMENLKQKWKTVFARPLPLKWLPVNDEDAVLWAWESLKKHQSGTFGSLNGIRRIHTCIPGEKRQNPAHRKGGGGLTEIISV